MKEEEREPSVASSSDLYSESDTPVATHQHAPTPTKRKAEDSAVSGPDKKRKLEPVSSSPSPSYLLPCVGLPPEIWQNVFLSCSPATLGRLLQVNRSFHSYLLDVQAPSKGSGRLNVIKSESIWITARKAHPTRPSKPPEGFSELELWRLIMGKKCHFCKKTSTSTPGEKPWEKGPGLDGVRIIWPFWVRACGTCLQGQCEKDATLLFSAASALRPALPFAFITSDLNVISASFLQDPALPPSLQISKVYYKPQVREIESELVEAQSRGSAAAEEWHKGLENRGRGRMNNSSIWERWEIKYQWWLNHQDARRTPMSTSASPSPNYPQKTGSPLRQVAESKSSNGLPGASKCNYLLPHQETRNPQLVPPPARWNPNENLATAQPLPPRPMASAQPVHAPQHLSQPPLHHPRPERNIHDANEAKAARKADIERRCEALSPPISANILRHMESFKAAIQISQPMTEYSWEVLKPRLLAQKAEAERAENEQTARMASLQTRIADRRQQDASLKEVKEVLDREWEDSQKPTRDRLSSYADDFIRSKWAGEKSINYDSSPRFAADLLIDARQRFYADVSKEDEIANGAQNQDLDNPNPTPRKTLILENMKWVYDNKIKPLTEQYRKELFICSACEGNFRYYGFEGVIQHYGAKHTSDFSVGNVVVSWREAEWPEKSPFHPDPSATRNAHSVPTSLPAHGHSAYAPYYGGYSRGGTTTPQMPIHLASPSPYLPYATQFNGPFPPPPPPPNPVQGGSYNYSQAYAQPQPMDPYNGYQPGYLGYSTSPLMNGSMQPPVPTANGSNSLGFQPSPLPVPAVAARQEPDKVESEFRTTLFDQQVRSLVEMARDIWTSTSGIKDLSNSVRVYVLLHRVISKFQLQFDHEPILDHFVDAVSNHPSLRGLKSATGLSCKACHADSLTQSQMSRAEDRKTYTTVSLFSHFKSIHLEKFGPRPSFQNGQQLRLLDWKEDMVDLPSDRSISGLIHAPGMDDDKLHIIATVFPTLFPTPLPRIGVVDQSGVASASLAEPKNTKGKDTIRTLVEDQGLGARQYPLPRPHQPSSRLGEEEYDPIRPALVRDSRHPVGASHRRPSHSWSPPPDDRRLYYAEPRLVVGGSQDYPISGRNTDTHCLKRPRDPVDDEYAGPPPRSYMEVSPNGTRYIRDTGPLYEEIRDRRSVYRERDVYAGPPPHGAYYPEMDAQDRDPYVHEGRPRERDVYRTEPQFVRDTRPRTRSPSRSRPETDAERFLNEFVPPPPLPQNIRREEDPHQAWSAEGDRGDGSRYTPPPVIVAPQSTHSDPNPPLPSLQPPSTNGSRYDDPHPRTPDSGNPPRRSAPYRRRDRAEYVPSRYARYMSAAREDPYARGNGIQRSHSRYERRYERYEEQRRRLDQEGKTPAPATGEDRERERDRERSRVSVDEHSGYADDPYYHQLRHSSREYVAVGDNRRASGPPPTRYVSRFATESADAPPPQYVDEFGEPVQYVRVREAYPPRYDDRERIEYVPVAYERGLGKGDRGREYVYYDERAPPREREGEGEEEAPAGER